MTRLDDLLDYLHTTTYFTDPASARFHLNCVGGLYEHSLNVVTNLRKLTSALDLKWKQCDSPEIIGLGHDVCKIGAYMLDGEGGYTFNPDQPEGHGDLSVAMVEKIIALTEEERACIRWHMGAYDIRPNWNHYNEAIHLYPNVLWTHTADMMATHIDEVA
jgi:hypothetical protein